MALWLVSIYPVLSAQIQRSVLSTSSQLSFNKEAILLDICCLDLPTMSIKDLAYPVCFSLPVYVFYAGVL
jgi:hypothetical protein